jgi:8-oxo-dGTP diphosphatase
MQFDETSTITPGYTGASIVVLDESLRVLLVCEGKSGLEGMWNTPGGGTEVGETPLEVAQRELYEETGLQNVKLEFLESFLFRGDRGDIILMNAFLVCIHSSTAIVPVFAQEILEARWFSKLEFDKMYENGLIRTHLTKLFVESAFNLVQKPSFTGEPT